MWRAKKCILSDLLNHTKLICGNWNRHWLDGRQSACILGAQVRNSVALQVVHHWKCRYKAGGLHQGFNKACFLSPAWDAKSFTHNGAPGFYSRTLWLVVYICCFGSRLFPLPGRSQITTRHSVCFNVTYECWRSHMSCFLKKKKKTWFWLGLQIEIGHNQIIVVYTCEKGGRCLNLMSALVFCSWMSALFMPDIYSPPWSLKGAVQPHRCWVPVFPGSEPISAAAHGANRMHSGINRSSAHPCHRCCS